MVPSLPIALNNCEVRTTNRLVKGTSFPQWATGMHTRRFPSQKLMLKTQRLDSMGNSIAYALSPAISDATCFNFPTNKWCKIPYNENTDHTTRTLNRPLQINHFHLRNSRFHWPLVTSTSKYRPTIPFCQLAERGIITPFFCTKF